MADMTPINMISNRGTRCTVPAHMGSALLDRGYTMAGGEVPPSGAVTSPNWNPGEGDSDGKMDGVNPFA